MEPNELSAKEAARRIASGELRSEDLVAACLERIAAREDDIRAWASVNPEQALSQARALDRDVPRGPLHGVPVGIKDVIDTADLPTEYNSPIYRGYQPRADAACVAQLRRSGCVILGKTVTTEFANNHPAKTRNPHRLTHTPGGSSSGSAAAVADWMVPIALATQTGGSTIRPASYCGVVGFKPSFNSINRAGLKFVAESLDTIGLIARAVEDIALALHVLSGRSQAEFEATATREPRIGLFRTPRWHEADAGAQAAVEGAAASLAAAGATVFEFEAPGLFAGLDEAQGRIMIYETARALGWELANHPADLSDSLRPRIDEGWAVSREAYDAARRLAREGRRQLAERMRDCDFVLTPATTGEAPATLSTTGTATFSRAWTLLGVPSVTLPFGVGPGGLPVGVQLAGRYDEDMQLLGWADWAARIMKDSG